MRPILTDRTDEWILIVDRGTSGDTCALRVLNGWLYRERECAHRDGNATSIALTFVPDTRK